MNKAADKKSVKKSKSDKKEKAKSENKTEKKEKKPKAKREKREGEPKKPPTAYFLFCADKRKENKDKKLSAKELGEMFSQLPQAEKDKYKKMYEDSMTKYEKELEEFNKTHPEEGDEKDNKKKNCKPSKSDQKKNNKKACNCGKCDDCKKKKGSDDDSDE